LKAYLGLAEKVKKTGAKYFVVEQPRVIITFSLANLLPLYFFLITQVRKVFFLEKRPKKPLALISCDRTSAEVDVIVFPCFFILYFERSEVLLALIQRVVAPALTEFLNIHC